TATDTPVPPTNTATATSPPATETPTSPPTSTSVAATSTSTPGVPTATETPCPLPFTDVFPTDYYYVPVQYLYCHGVVSGYCDNTFRPFNNTTRGQMVKIVVLGFGVPLVTPGAQTFSDVPPSQPFYLFVETAAAHNIVSGYSDGTFRPQNNVTRGQLSKIDVVAAGWPPLTPATGTFADVAPGGAFYSFVEAAYCRGIISGYACGGPGEPCDDQ